MFCLYNFLYTYSKIFFYKKNLNFINTQLKAGSYSVFNSFSFLHKITSHKNIINKNNYSYQFKHNNKYYYSFNKNNFFYFNKFCNLLSTMFVNNKNVLIFDSEYKTLIPLYNYIFGFKNLRSNKSFFLLKKEDIIRTNWFYLYSRNIDRFKINALVLLDYVYFKKFLSVFKRFNLPIMAFVPNKIESVYADYYVFINFFNINLSKFFLVNFLTSLFFKNSSLNFFKKKLFFLDSYKIFTKLI